MATLAGPVVAAACLVTPDVRLIRAVRDSKLLTRQQREELVPEIRARVTRIGRTSLSMDCEMLDAAASTAIAYLFRFRAGRVISSTSYASLDDAIAAAAACSAYSR